jgi:hypothetical protein
MEIFQPHSLVLVVNELMKVSRQGPYLKKAN